MTVVAVVMPAFNERAVIAEFLAEIHDAFGDLDVRLVVADDCSTDGTDAVLEQQAPRLPLTVLTNPRNQGHGPTTLRAMRAGLDTGADVVVTVDGDGHFAAGDIRLLTDRLLRGGVDIVEGARSVRSNPIFRRVTSYATRVLVAQRARHRPLDANTPLRVYRREVLGRLLDVLPPDAMTPNLLISAQSRLWGLTIAEIPVEFRARGGRPVPGTTWQARTTYLPSKRFLRFCVQATREWIRTPRDLGTDQS